MSCFLLSEGQSRETSVLYRTELQKNVSTGASSVCTGPAGAAGILPTSSNAPSHRHWAGWCRHIQVALHGASVNLTGLVDPGLAQHLLGWNWAGLYRTTCALVLPGLVVLIRGTQWSSEAICRLPVSSPAGLDDCSSFGIAVTALVWCSWSDKSNWNGAPEPVLFCIEDCRQWSCYIAGCHHSRCDIKGANIA